MIATMKQTLIRAREGDKKARQAWVQHFVGNQFQASQGCDDSPDLIFGGLMNRRPPTKGTITITFGTA